MKAIAHRFWSKTCPIFYVESIKEKTGDWGYTTDVTKALPLTPKQQKRFTKDCLIAGEIPTFIKI